METIKELKNNDEKASELTQCLQAAIKLLGEISPTRETALVKTKIEEAGMWLEKYRENLSFKLAHKICR